MPMTQLIATNGGGMINPGGGTLRRGMRGIVPPPDVTHHTNHSKSTHDLHSSLNQNVSQQTLNNHSNKPITSQLSSNNSSMTTQKQPPGILKDPNRKQQQQQQQQLQQQQQQQMHPHANMQILNVQNAPGIGNSLLMGMGGSNGGGNSVGVGTYDPNTHNLSSFNASMGYTDADGHLV